MFKFLSPYLDRQTKNKIHLLFAKWAVFLHSNPSSRIKVIGVTGTQGKTTVCNMISSILDQAGLTNALETTINTRIAGENIERPADYRRTTPTAAYLQEFLDKAVKAGCSYAIIEVSSQAIDQNRIHGIKFHSLVFTNLTHEHLDYHGTKENYLNTKLKLFKNNPEANFIINADDPSWNRFYSLSGLQKYLFSIKKSVEHGAIARKILSSPSDTTFTAVSDNGQITIDLNIPGLFNVQNALAAFCVGMALEISLENIKRGIEDIRLIAGRMEPIRVSKHQNFTVLIDYAHTPDSLKNVYETVKESIKNSMGRLIAVLGATGNRDISKRPIMGAMAGHFADLVVFTNEDPYDEDPVAIMEAVAEGIHKGAEKKHQWRLNRNYWKVIDRAQAIHKAIREAKKGDVVIITGKGDESVMAVSSDKFVPFSDRNIAKQELSEIFGRK
ncbi:MAG: UDP-N-acetylmuramoyl-L-alanyl-D-glutamate--2,6-diaminopimelate ligase [Candidatus Berkelbacteria bacterium]